MIENIQNEGLFFKNRVYNKGKIRYNVFCKKLRDAVNIFVKIYEKRK